MEGIVLPLKEANVARELALLDHVLDLVRRHVILRCKCESDQLTSVAQLVHAHMNGP